VADEPTERPGAAVRPGGEDLERASGFLQAHLDSYAQMEVLRLLARAKERSWTAEAVARELRLAPAEAAAALDHLCARNLLDIRISGGLHFRYSPGSDDLKARAEAFLAVLARDPVAVSRLMADHQCARERSAGLQAFIDAFVLRGRGKNG
jgi:hypothetical protein